MEFAGMISQVVSLANEASKSYLSVWVCQTVGTSLHSTEHSLTSGSRSPPSGEHSCRQPHPTVSAGASSKPELMAVPLAFLSSKMTWCRSGRGSGFLFLKLPGFGLNFWFRQFICWKEVLQCPQSCLPRVMVKGSGWTCIAQQQSPCICQFFRHMAPF